jgi:hypothetical protein
MTATETKWSERVREWKASGKTAKEFAEGQDFKPSTLVYWASCLRHRSDGAGKPLRSAPRVRMARVVPVSPRADDGIVVVVGAARIAVRAGFDRLLLREVIAALGGER